MIINNFKQTYQPNFTANVMPKNCAEHINNKLKQAKTVDIFCHTSSDEDTFNSAKAMYSYLSSEGIKPRIIVSGGKECYDYDTSKYNIIQASDVNDKTEKADMAFCVDFSSSTRAVPNVLKYIQSYGKNIVGFDHHNDKDVITTDYNKITTSYAKIQDMPKLDEKDYYIDSSAKSNCAIISRFFDAIGHKITRNEAKSLFAGMYDDMSKDGIVTHKGLNVTVNDLKANDNGNTKEVMKSVLGKLNILDKLEIFKHFLDKTKLTPQEEAFKKGLDNRTRYTQNGKMAYIAIKPDDNEWNSLGKDCEHTKIILGDYRKKMLSGNKNLKAVAVFYPSSENNVYKMSILTKEDYAKQIIDDIKKTVPDLTAGGHENRSGGSIVTENTDKYFEWVNHFTNSAEKIL